MDSVLRSPAHARQRALLLAVLAIPLTGWTVHALVLQGKLATTRRDPLTGLLRRDGYTAKARRLIDRHTCTAAVVLVDRTSSRRSTTHSAMSSATVS